MFFFNYSIDFKIIFLISQKNNFNRIDKFSLKKSIFFVINYL